MMSLGELREMIHYECCQFENQNYKEFLNSEKTA